MLLAVEIGNTHISVGGFDGDELVFVAPIATDPRRTAVQIAVELTQVFALLNVDRAQLSCAVVGSVVPSLTPCLLKALSLLGIADVLHVTSGVRTGLNIQIEQPRLLGCDLAANAVWACAHAPMPCVIVDMGTATTFTLLDQSGTLIGTAIAAGVQMSMDALKRGAAQLSEVRLTPPRHGVFGRNTAEAIQAGVLLGAASMVEGMLSRYEEALSQRPHVLLTGGAAPWIAPHLKVAVQHEAHLTLRGLCCIWQKNRT